MIRFLHFRQIHSSAIGRVPSTSKRLYAGALLCLTLSAFAQKASTTTTTYFPAKPLPGVTPPNQMMAMPAIGPLFLQNDQISSSLMLVNNAASSAGATITLRNLTGRQIAQQHIVLAPSSQHEIAMAYLLSTATEYASMGSLSIIQDAGLQGVAVNAQLLLTDHSHSIPSYLDEELAMPSMEGSSTLRGVTDAAQGPSLLAISNLANKSQTVTVKCLSHEIQDATTQIIIPAYGTSLTSACSNTVINNFEEYLESVPHQEDTEVQGIEITGGSMAGTLAAFALAPHHRGSEVIFSAAPFTDPQMQKSSTTIYAGVPFGKQSVVSDGVYVPHIALANFSDKQANVTITVTDSNERYPRDGALLTDFLPQPHLRSVSLAPGESKNVILNDARNQAGLLHSIKVQSDQPAGLVQSKVVSRGDGVLYQVELLGKDLKDQENAGGHPWTTQGDNESHLLLYNPSAIPTTYLVRIAAATSTWEKKYVLAPNETRELSINRLIHEGIKDDSGRVLDPGANTGVVYWSLVDPGHGTGRLLVSSQSQTAARNFSCGYTYVVCGVALSVLDNGLVPLLGYSNYAFVNAQCCLAWGPGACSNLTQTGGSCGTSINWTLGDTTIVDFNTSGDQFSFSPNFKGVSAGNTYANAYVQENGCGSGGGGNPTPTVPPCPTEVVIDQIWSQPLQNDFPAFQTGVGILTRMKVGPVSTDFTGAVVSETVTPIGNSCPASIQSATNFPNVVFSNFVIPQSAAWEGNNYPSAYNAYYDAHTIKSASNVLSGTGVSSCQATATQTYSCAGQVFGKFNLTNTYQAGYIGGTPVTFVTVTKQ